MQLGFVLFVCITLATRGLRVQTPVVQGVEAFRNSEMSEKIAVSTSRSTDRSNVGVPTVSLVAVATLFQALNPATAFNPSGVLHDIGHSELVSQRGNHLGYSAAKMVIKGPSKPKFRAKKKTVANSQKVQDVLVKSQKKSQKKRFKSWTGPSAARRGQNRIWAERRVAGDKFEKKAPKNTHWESQGDRLYEEQCVDPNIIFPELAPDEIKQAAEKIMSKLLPDALEEDAPAPENSTSIEQHPGRWCMWGNISVGPALKSRLVDDLGMSSPMPIQEAVFAPISKGTNVVISSATGSGKTLAFLLPILARANRRIPCSTLIVVASQELVRQVKSVIDSLWPPNKLGSAVHILGESRSVENPRFREELISLREVPILVGIPQAVQQFMYEATLAKHDRRAGCQQANLLSKNLRVLVLDEADKLLDSASLVQAEIKRKEMLKNQVNHQTLNKNQRIQIKKRQGLTITEKMLRMDFPKVVALSDMQVICTSATVGRTLRRQLQGLLGGVSIEKTSTLVSLSQFVAKNQRRATLMPRRLEHRYVFVDRPPISSVSGSEDLEYAAMQAKLLRSAMDQLPPGPAIVFCGKEGNERLFDALSEIGMKGLERLKDAYEDEGTLQGFNWDTDEQLDAQADMVHDAEKSWENMPLYIGAERYGRGIDLEVDYVFLLWAPSSSGRYMHMAGRTARSGRPGVAISIIDYFQAPLMKTYAEHLGISFAPLGNAG